MLQYRGAIASGKTYAGAIRTMVRRQQYPGTRQIIGGPSWDQLRDGTMETLRRILPDHAIVSENKVEHHWVLPNGSDLIFRTLDNPSVLRALEGHDMWVDENAMCSDEVLSIGLGRIRLPHSDPTFVNSWWGTSTPRGMDWTLDTFGMEGKIVTYTDPEGQERQIEYGVVHSTIYDNRVNLPAGYIETLEEKYRDTPFFEQELLGMYTAFEGLVYPMFLAETHVTDEPCALRECAKIGFGLDFGGTAAPTAGVCFGETASGRAHQYGEFYKNDADLDDIVAWLDDMRFAAGLERNQVFIWCDTSEATSIRQLGTLGFAARGANKDRRTGINTVAGQLRSGALTIGRNCLYTKMEYGQYVWARKRDGETKVVYITNQPIDHHADAMDATRYCRMGMLTAGVVREDAQKNAKAYQEARGRVRA